MGILSVLPVPAFKDNYLWLIHDDECAVAVDPGDSAPIFDVLNAQKLSLVAILLTHHHADHVGGVQSLLQRARIPVYGPRSESISGVTQLLAEGDHVSIPELALDLSVLDVPGHTSGHIAYIARQQRWLFCGDTLFAGGCGRLFEGTPAQMVASLAKIAKLSDDTQIFCAHEYTLSNLRFALAVDPGNAALHTRIGIEQGKRDQGQPTVPSALEIEKATNPFLRYRETPILASLKAAGRLTGNDPVAAFTALREWKNNFQ